MSDLTVQQLRFCFSRLLRRQAKLASERAGERTCVAVATLHPDFPNGVSAFYEQLPRPKHSVGGLVGPGQLSKCLLEHTQEVLPAHH